MYRISPNKCTRPNRRSPLDFLACNILFFSQKLQVNPSSIADNIEQEERYVNKKCVKYG